MGNSCSFGSPEFLPQSYLATPTYAVDPTNSGYLSANGRFFTNIGQGYCPNPTKVNSQTQVITPYLLGPDGTTTRCNQGTIAPSTTDTGSFKVTTFTPFVCPEATLTAMPTGTYKLGFAQNQTSDRGGAIFYTVDFPLQTFVIAAVPTSTQTIFTTTTTTLAPEFAATTIETETEVSSTTEYLEPTPSSTTIITVFSSTSTVEETAFESPVSTSTVLVNTCTPTSTMSSDTSTTTSSSETSSTIPTTTSSSSTSSSTSASNPAPTCAAGTAALPLSCPGAEGKCYTTTNGKVFQIQCGKGHYNGNLALVKKPTYQSCVDACSLRPKCVGVTFIAPTGQAVNGDCNLKSTVNTSIRSGRLRTGAVLLTSNSGASKSQRRKVQQRAALADPDPAAPRTGSHPDYTLTSGPPSTTSTITSTETPAPEGTTTETTTTTITTTFQEGPSASGIETDTVQLDTTITTTTTVTSSSVVVVTSNVCDDGASMTMTA